MATQALTPRCAMRPNICTCTALTVCCICWSPIMVVGVVFQSCQLRDIIHSEPRAPIIHAHVLSAHRCARYATLPGVLAAVLVLLVLYMTVVVATVACSHPLQAALATTAALCRVLLALFVVMVVFGE